jgi:predicted PurR-regulated permease PerM
MHAGKRASPSEIDRWGIPRWVMRLVLILAGVVVALFAAYHILNQLRSLIVMLVFALFLSIALEPGVNYLHKKGWKRGLATGSIFLVVVVVSGLFIGLMIPLIVDQVGNFIDRLPGYIDKAGELAERWFGVEFSSERIQQALADAEINLADVANDVAGSVFGVGATLLATLFQILTIGLFTFYMTAEGPKLRRGICSLLPPERQREVLRVLDIAIEKTGGYFYSRALLALIASALAWAVFSVVGLPFALALALWMGVLSQFIPVVGTYIGGALPLLIALFEGWPEALVVLGFIVLYQVVENYFLSPKITAHTMALHPAVAFGAVIAGATLLGVPGTLMALPVAATFQAFVSTYLRRHEVIESYLTEAGPSEEEAEEEAPAER